ncbi:TonB-dependent receptor [Sphingosinicella rhizophila]|nr:TonB-dependent receptor [Sphingosinicella sp. GR2756]
MAQAAPSAAQQRTQRFDIAAQPAADALNEWARQAGSQIVFPYDKVQGRTTPAVRGNLTQRAALDRLLAPLDLRIASDRDGRVTLAAAEPEAENVTVPPGQGAPANALADNESAEIVVTGSRIRRDATEGVRPTQSVTTEAITDRGLLSVADAINLLPQIGQPETPRGQQGEAVGRNYINMFGLGSQRTLTLVNGRRFVTGNPVNGGSSSGNQVDLNNIPTLVIDRVEVVQATGAATYGSDAISGVINIILKEDFTGLLVDGQAGISSRGDYFNYAFRALGGVSFADGRGNIMVSYERSSNDGVAALDRPSTGRARQFAANPLNKTSSDGIPAQVPLDNRRAPEVTFGGLPFIANSFALNAIASIPDPNNPARRIPVQFASDGTLVPYDVGNVLTTFVSSGGDGYNFQKNLNLYTPLTRDTAYAVARFDLTDNVRLFSELSASWIKGTELANQALTVNVGLLAQPSGLISVNIDNPFLTDQARGILQDQGVTNFYLARGNLDLAANGRTDSRSSTKRIVLGLEGDFRIGNRDFFWNAAGSYGHTGGYTEHLSIVNQNFLYAVDAVRAPNGNIVCRVTLENPASSDPAITGCKPLNLFGEGAGSAEAIDYVNTEVRNDSDLYQTNFQANVGGDLFTLPAGMLKFAAGYEYRKERGKFVPNDAAQRGITRDGVIREVPGPGEPAAAYSVNEVYGEISVPLVGGDFTLPLVKALTIDGAARFVDNSQAGKDTAWNVGGRWTLADGIVVRGSISRTFRAPSIVELRLPRSQFRNRVNVDPCDKDRLSQGPNPSARQANCSALFQSLGLPANFQLDSVAEALAFPQTRGGNPDLKNETSDSWTVGVALEPPFIPGLSFTADYVSISIKDAIVSFDGTAILSNCLDADLPNPDTCALVQRGPTAQITEITTGFVNAGFINFRGISYTLAYRMRLAGEQRLNLSLDVLNTRRQEVSVSGLGFDLDPVAGEIAAPHWKGQFRISYINGPFQLNWFTNYVGSAAHDVKFTSEDLAPLKTGDYFKHDASIQFEIARNFAFRAGVNNIFDRQPDPLAIGSNAIGGTYDVLGRTFFAGATMRF